VVAAVAVAVADVVDEEGEPTGVHPPAAWALARRTAAVAAPAPAVAAEVVVVRREGEQRPKGAMEGRGRV